MNVANELNAIWTDYKQERQWKEEAVIAKLLLIACDMDARIEAIEQHIKEGR